MPEEYGIKQESTNQPLNHRSYLYLKVFKPKVKYYRIRDTTIYILCFSAGFISPAWNWQNAQRHQGTTSVNINIFVQVVTVYITGLSHECNLHRILSAGSKHPFDGARRCEIGSVVWSLWDTQIHTHSQLHIDAAIPIQLVPFNIKCDDVGQLQCDWSVSSVSSWFWSGSRDQCLCCQEKVFHWNSLLVRCCTHLHSFIVYYKFMFSGPLWSVHGICTPIKFNLK